MIAWNKIKIQWGSYSELLKPFWQRGELDILYSKLKEAKAKGDEISPLSHQLWSPLILTPLDKLRCVIVGSHPYNYKINNVQVADGLLLGASNHAEDKNPHLPEELKNWCRAIEIEFNEELGLGNIMDGWVSYFLAKEGCLMWHQSLTTVIGREDNPHLELWAPFQDFFFKVVVAPLGIPIVVLGEDLLPFYHQKHQRSPIVPIEDPKSEHFSFNGELKSVQQLVLDKTGYRIDFSLSLPF